MDRQLWLTQQVAYVPPVEATQEFKVQTNTYDAQYGRTGGGIISLSIKPGTNKLHGAVYEYMRAHGSMPISIPTTQPARPNSFVDQYGFEIDRAGFHAEGIPRERPDVFHVLGGEVSRFPAATGDRLGPHRGTAERAIFPDSNRTGNMYTVYDPLTNHANPNFNPARPVSLTNLQYIRDPFPGNRVPRERMDPGRSGGSEQRRAPLRSQGHHRHRDHEYRGA